MTLNEVMKDTADAIREKTGKSEKIAPINFAEEIKSISAGGGESGGEKQVGWFFPTDSQDTANPLYNGLVAGAGGLGSVAKWVDGLALCTAYGDNKATGLWHIAKDVFDTSVFYSDLAIKKGVTIKIEGLLEKRIDTFEDYLDVIYQLISVEFANSDIPITMDNVRASIRNRSVDEYLTSIAM